MKTIWSNFNLAEVLPGVCPPLVTSFYVPMVNKAFVEMLGIDEGEPVIKVFSGRLYFNLTALEEGIKKTAGTDKFSVTEALGGSGAMPDTGTMGIFEKMRFLFFGFKMSLHSRKSKKYFDAKVLPGISKKASEYSDRIDAVDGVEELLGLEDELSSYIKHVTITGLDSMSYRMGSYFIFNNTCKKWLGYGSNRLLVSGNENIEMIGSFEYLWNLSRLIKTNPDMQDSFMSSGEAAAEKILLGGESGISGLYTGFLKKFGDRSIKELDFSQPRWKEDASYLIDIIKTYLELPDSSSPPEKIKKIQAEFENKFVEATKDLPQWKSNVLMSMRKKAQAALAMREKMKSEAVRLFVPYRKLILKLGRKIEEKDLIENALDIFFLHRDELSGLKDSDSLKEKINVRKTEFEDNKKKYMPDTIVEGEENTDDRKPAYNGENLKGIGVSSGIVEARARVVGSIEKISEIKNGEILVTDHTDPGWTPVFVVVSGVITNTGGLLSHAAIVAREYGLPAVVNLKNATRIIKTGDMIRLDSDSGEVEIIE